MLYKRVDLKEAEEKGLKVQFLGAYVLRWREEENPDPQVGFVEAEDEDIKKEYEQKFGHPH